ncbi:hypothetical protein [Acinetobacter boissieri]|uniref:Uncharacterized protein n=1 Tax=Acinetobacter boissieri TaxID=1219383 RepID=A0A1G6GXY4_9GAMM|nr:hypothetical protein [Acinetobacter boissieri]SDB86773.1 hypothetical protein SAMN05421733_1034 [Acinetobacter boissieri]
MTLAKEVQKIFDAQNKSIADCERYFYKNGTLASFDSVAMQPERRPTALQAIFDSIGVEHHSDIDNAVRLGVAEYQARNGGDLPDASVIATALCSASQLSQSLKGDQAKPMFDSIAQIAGFDSISNQNYEQAAIVPAMAIVTIASVIANSLPIVTMLPNPSNSVRVPVVAVRYITDSKFGAMQAGDYLDGANAGLPYAEGRFRFKLTAKGNAAYAVTAHSAYADFKGKTPDNTAVLLPFLSGNVSIRINGIEVAHTRADQSSSVASGIVTAMPKRGVLINGIEYKVISSEINVDTSEISVTLNIDLPEEAIIEVALVVDFDAKDAQKKHKINPVGLSLKPEYDSIQSVPIQNRITLSYTTQNQLASELGLGFVGAALVAIQGKVFLEQNLRLLGEGKERAQYNGREYTFDASRSVAGNLTAAVTTFSDLIGRVTATLDLAKLSIRQATGSNAGFTLYVGNKGTVYFNQLDASIFKKTGATAAFGEIVRIGTLSDGTDVYHAPTEYGLLAEEGNAVEALLVGRGSEPTRNPFVGTITEAPTFREAKPDSRDVEFGSRAQMAAELNPLSRYADQVAVISLINLPTLGN